MKRFYENMQIYEDIAVITHGSDNDGVFSAYQICDVFGIPHSAITFTEPGIPLNGVLTEVVDRMACVMGRKLITITDLSITKDDRAMLEELIEDCEQLNIELIFVDHHGTTMWAESIENLPESILIKVSTQFCAAKLVNQLLRESGIRYDYYDHLEAIANVVNDRDMFYRTMPVSTQIELVTKWAGPEFALGMFKDMLRMVGESSEPIVVIPAYIRETIKVLERKTQRSVEAAVDKVTLVQHPFGDLKIGAYLDIGSTSDVCANLIANHGYDAVISFMPSYGTVSIRSNDKMDSSKFAVWQKGGGHPRAAGYKLDSFTTIETLSHFEWLINDAMFDYDSMLRNAVSFELLIK